MVKKLPIACLALCIAGFSAPAAGEPGEYRYLIQPGDRLELIVWPYDDLSLEIQVRPDGMISYPFMGEFKVEGMTAGELGEIVTREVKEYVHEPKVAVNLLQFRMPRVYVLGQVRNPGLYEIRKGDTIMDALAQAGGPSEKAWLSSVGLIRPSEQEKEGNAGVKEINVARLLGKGELPDEYLVTDGDIIYVPGTKKTDWGKVYTILSSIYYTFAIDDIIRRNF
ncbi:MAG: polysaccharide biosynthesis/export family protein [bacterium]